MKNIRNFSELKSELYKEDIYRHMKTLCFDVENVFVRKINLKDVEELNTLKQCQNYELNYVLISKEKRSSLEESKHNVATPFL